MSDHHEQLQVAADWLMSQGHTNAARALDVYIEGQTDMAARPGTSCPERLRKTGYLVAQPLGGRFLVESFVVVGEECLPVNDTAGDAAELAELILRHFSRLGGTR